MKTSVIDFRLHKPLSCGEWVPGGWDPIGTPGHDYFYVERELIPALSKKTPTVREFVVGYQPNDKQHVSVPFLAIWRGEIVRYDDEKLIVVRYEKTLPIGSIGPGVLVITEHAGHDGIDIAYSAPTTETHFFDEEAWEWKRGEDIPAFRYSATLYKGQTVCAYAARGGIHKKPMTAEWRDTEW